MDVNLSESQQAIIETFQRQLAVILRQILNGEAEKQRGDENENEEQSTAN